MVNTSERRGGDLYFLETVCCEGKNLYQVANSRRIYKILADPLRGTSSRSCIAEGEVPKGAKRRQWWTTVIMLGLDGPSNNNLQETIYIKGAIIISQKA